MSYLNQIPYKSFTTSQRDALTGVPIGLKITNSTIGRNQMWNGPNWIEIDEGELRWRDEYVSGIWTPAAAQAAPSIIGYTIGGISVNKYTFNGTNTEERIANHFEIPHDIPLDLINDGTTYIEAHIHWQPSTNDAGNVQWFFDWAYLPLNGAPIAMNSLSCINSVSSNQQFFHKLCAFESAPNVTKLQIPAGGFNVGGVIQFNLRRTPTGDADTYEYDAILVKVALHVPTDDRGSKDIYNN